MSSGPHRGLWRHPGSSRRSGVREVVVERAVAAAPREVAAVPAARARAVQAVQPVQPRVAPDPARIPRPDGRCGRRKPAGGSACRGLTSPSRTSRLTRSPSPGSRPSTWPSSSSPSSSRSMRRVSRAAQRAPDAIPPPAPARNRAEAGTRCRRTAPARVSRGSTMRGDPASLFHWVPKKRLTPRTAGSTAGNRTSPQYRRCLPLGGSEGSGDRNP